jgi:phosphonate degradation associated HDIG domain protein
MFIRVSQRRFMIPLSLIHLISRCIRPTFIQTDMPAINPVETALELLEKAAARRYGGEPVSQLEHALQCAHQAEQAQVPDDLVVAALLHDLGHLLHDLGEGATQRGLDDKHEVRALHLLRRAFGGAVLEPIRLHVDAKRYLCEVDTAYYDTLTPASKASLALQGGPFSADQAQRFILQPQAREAARLRVWDDHAKTPRVATPPLEHYAEVMRRCASQYWRYGKPGANRG